MAMVFTVCSRCVQLRAEEQFSLTLDFMERRLLKGNQEAGMRLNGMRHQIELAKQEAEEVRELQDVSDEAVVGAKEAYTKLVRMRSAVDEMSGRYEELRQELYEAQEHLEAGQRFVPGAFEPHAQSLGR